jgi:hypothetical protein
VYEGDHRQLAHAVARQRGLLIERRAKLLDDLVRQHLSSREETGEIAWAAGLAGEQPGTTRRQAGVHLPLDGRAGHTLIPGKVRGRGADLQADHAGHPLPGSGQGRRAAGNGVRKGVGPLSVNLTEFARSLPSLHQLLPSYACCDHAGSLYRLDEITVPLEEILIATPVRRRAAAAVSIRVTVPDLILDGEAFPVVVDIEAD